MAIQSVALVAHDHKKAELMEWTKTNQRILNGLNVFATGTTGMLLEDILTSKVNKLLSGPLGGDQQIGAKIAEGLIDMLIFFWDPLEPMPHDPDIKALLRIAAVWNIPVACNVASADFIINSSLIESDYLAEKPDYSGYLARNTKVVK